MPDRYAMKQIVSQAFLHGREEGVQTRSEQQRVQTAVVWSPAENLPTLVFRVGLSALHNFLATTKMNLLNGTMVCIYSSTAS